MTNRTARPTLTIAQHRRAALLTQEQLADRAGISRTALSRIENGVHEPRLTTQALIATALRVAPEEVLWPSQYRGASWS